MRQLDTKPNEDVEEAQRDENRFVLHHEEEDNNKCTSSN